MSLGKDKWFGKYSYENYEHIQQGSAKWLSDVNKDLVGERSTRFFLAYLIRGLSNTVRGIFKNIKRS